MNLSQQQRAFFQYIFDENIKFGDSEGYLKVFQLNDMKKTRYIQGHLACLSCIAMSIQENEIITSIDQQHSCFKIIDLLLIMSLNKQIIEWHTLRNVSAISAYIISVKTYGFDSKQQNKDQRC
ncbi:unnamed protein product [Paramecium sonneborni]|uniref:Uncharacterized protein n=1 Tax=Paramecium sonneborni TaxID=65129 RepID=A0A8S1L8T5_9CILI|nr:unnamed protein product [Paramecium sonneborni]